MADETSPTKQNISGFNTVKGRNFKWKVTPGGSYPAGVPIAVSQPHPYQEEKPKTPPPAPVSFKAVKLTELSEEKAAKVAQKLKEVGKCDAGYDWLPQEDGSYKCKGGGHHVPKDKVEEIMREVLTN